MASKLGFFTNIMKKVEKRIFYLLIVASYPIMVPGLLSASVFIFSDIEKHRVVGSSTEFAVINYPQTNSQLPEKFKAQGDIKKYPIDSAVFLVSNSDNLYWPKIKIDKENPNWEHYLTVKPGSKFMLAVISVDKVGEKTIDTWFENGKKYGKYPALKDISGLKTLAQVLVKK